ncbi:hypothetical protein [Roseibium sp. MMSF_3544]|uniref:hypothetical protein n=1 Tax=unclassified Roseibium TaxID=2629323 RepID=UPI00273F208B|nr:hypothetical protein [Roseibium sp. MMSF_3544]
MNLAKHTLVLACTFLLVFVWVGPEAREMFILLGILEDPMQNGYIPSNVFY